MLSLHPITVEGLLCAAESCAEMLGRVVRGGDILSGDAFDSKTLEAAYMEKAWMAARHIRNQRTKD